MQRFKKFEVQSSKFLLAIEQFGLNAKSSDYGLRYSKFSPLKILPKTSQKWHISQVIGFFQPTISTELLV